MKTRETPPEILELEDEIAVLETRRAAIVAGGLKTVAEQIEHFQVLIAIRSHEQAIARHRNKPIEVRGANKDISELSGELRQLQKLRIDDRLAELHDKALRRDKAANRLSEYVR
ncbi:hypothetical protein [Nannocystis pusilla]|uniref:hypothetical protein n=1 Tax=Nannocystis pusilla TaxID=889268 RepID=UPI003DA2E0A3